MQCLTNEIIFCGFRKHSLSGLQLHSSLQDIQRPDCRAANLTVFRRRKAFLLCKNPCGGTAVGMGSPAQSGMHRPRKEISRGNLLCAKSGLPNLSYPRLESAQKYVGTLDKNNPNTGQPRGARGTRSLCFGKSPEEPLPRGSFGQLLRGGSTPRFFSQIRSVGSKNGPAGRVLPENHTPR